LNDSREGIAGAGVAVARGRSLVETLQAVVMKTKIVKAMSERVIGFPLKICSWKFGVNEYLTNQRTNKLTNQRTLID